jgi:hypothetical protein
MGRSGTHSIFSKDREFKGYCGPVQSLYARVGGDERWVVVVRMCLTCHAFWPTRVPARFRQEGEINVESRDGLAALKLGDKRLEAMPVKIGGAPYYFARQVEYSGESDHGSVWQIVGSCPPSHRHLTRAEALECRTRL